MYLSKVEISIEEVAGVRQSISIFGTKMGTEDDASESAALAAILSLETERDIYVVDLNYNRRAHGGHYVCEVEMPHRLFHH